MMQHSRTQGLLPIVFFSFAILTLSSEWASAQSAPSAAPGFFLNNPHPAFPWHYPPANQAQVLGETETPPRSVVIPMEVAQPGSQPPTVEWQQVTLPGYQVTETTAGFIVHGHWGVRPMGNVYYWRWVPTYFRSK